VRRVCSSVEILQGLLLDVCGYSVFCRSCWLACILNEWEDTVEYSIDLEVRDVPLVHRPQPCVVVCSCFQLVGIRSVTGQ